MKNQRGQSLFELVLAIGVSAIIITVLVSLVNNAVQAATFSKNQTLATRYAESGTEWLRTQRDTDIATFLINASTAPLSWCLKDSPLVNSSWTGTHHPCGASEYITGTIFVRQVDFNPTSPSGKTVIIADVVVSWTDSKGNHKITNSTQFSDWRQR